MRVANPMVSVYCQEAQIIELSLRGGTLRIERCCNSLVDTGERPISRQNTTLTVTENASDIRRICG